MLVSSLGFAALLLLSLAGLPLGFAMASVGLVGFASFRGLAPSFSMAAQQVVDLGMNYGLSVIPLFVLMGSLIFKAGVADDLFGTASLGTIVHPGQHGATMNIGERFAWQAGRTHPRRDDDAEITVEDDSAHGETDSAGCALRSVSYSSSPNGRASVSSMIGMSSRMG